MRIWHHVERTILTDISCGINWRRMALGFGMTPQVYSYHPLLMRCRRYGSLAMILQNRRRPFSLSNCTLFKLIRQRRSMTTTEKFFLTWRKNISDRVAVEMGMS